MTFGGRISGVQLSVSTLAALRSRFERQTIVDRTGLRDSYDLKLESWKGPLDVLIIDHAEKTLSEN